jgi:tyrosine-protein kinase Etk/Wzc
MATTPTNPATEQDADALRIQDLLYLCLAKWKWFVLSLAVCIGLAVVYILRTPPVYTRTASVLIKEESRGKSISSDLGDFSNMGLFQSKTNVNNEVIAFASPAMISEVVNRLHLDMKYYKPGTFHDEVAYGLSLPVSVELPNLLENESASFTLDIQADSTVAVSEFVLNGETVTDDKSCKGKLNAPFSSPIGVILVQTGDNYLSGESYTLYVRKGNFYGTVSACSANLTVALSSEKATVIDLTYKDNSSRRAEDFLNTLISVYNEKWVKDKNQIAVSTSMFINERLGVIERELGNVDNDISSYKSEHLIPDVKAASNLYMTQGSQANLEQTKVQNQLYMTRYVRNYLTNEENRYQLLPANSGIESSSIENQIAEYNRQLLQRNSLVANSSTSNPLVVDMDAALGAMRSAIITSIDNQIVTLNAQISSLQQTERQATSRIASNPTQAKYLLSVERQQKVKESLYLFLLQKREENELSQAFTAYNTRIINPPYGRQGPTSPVRRNILLLAIALGLCIPLGIIYLREVLNTRIRGRKDLEDVTVPFAGEIPLLAAKKKLFASNRKANEVHRIVVEQGNRDGINEAFRVLRTNLEFMMNKDKSQNVSIVTSFNPGSGKSFLCINIAVSFAIKDKKVLVIDGDFRRGSTSEYVGSPHHGLSNYLSHQDDDLMSLIRPMDGNPNLSVLPVGTMPPNPTELLFDARFKEAIETVRPMYDYIFIDCPPIEIVADTQIIETLADRTIFVVRANLLERSMVPELEKIYREHKFKNLTLILNGSTASAGHGHYGYRYGYHYGYHYGYGNKGYYGSSASGSKKSKSDRGGESVNKAQRTDK